MDIFGKGSKTNRPIYKQTLKDQNNNYLSELFLLKKSRLIYLKYCYYILMINIEKLKINIKIENMQKSLQVKVIYALRNGPENGFILVVAEDLQSKSGSIIEQSGINDTDFIFQIIGVTNIDQKNVLERVNVRCRELDGKYLIPNLEFKAIIEEINKGNLTQQNNNDEQRQSDSESDNEDDSGGQEDNDSLIESHQIKRQISEYHDYSDAQNQDGNPKKGRGRPKGSRNKKTLEKQQFKEGKDSMYDLKMALSGKIKRGKGRPKGSKNRPKEKMQVSNIKLENDETPFGKRGKGRPKGSKNKIKMPQQPPNVSSENMGQKRGRGRPKGAKNKPHSTPSIEQSKQKSQVVQKFKYIRQDFQEIDKIYCCRRCYQFKLKRSIYDEKINIEDFKDQINNVFEDLSLENRNNIILNFIKYGQPNYHIKKLLQLVHQTETYFIPPFQTDRLVEKTNYEVRTKKQYLSKTGKEGLSVLLHDVCKKKEIWWKEVGLERIVQAIPNQSPGRQIFKQLCNCCPELKQQLYKALPNFIRCGNAYVAEIILQQVLTSTNNQYNYSQEHLELINANSLLLNQYKKSSLIKHNSSTNFCSPIHCAAICNNPHFMRQLLQVFGDIINVEDSMCRKPVHYASSCLNQSNLEALVENGAQLREYDKKKITPLMIACIYGIPSNVEYITEKVRDPGYINSKSEEGLTALHYAILKNHLQCVDILVNDPYIDLSAVNKQQQDIFHMVAGTGNLQIFQKFIQKRETPTNVDKFKRTPVMIAIRNHHNDLMYRLLEEGSKHTKSDSSNNSLLHYAAAYGNIEAIILLLSLLPQQKNKKGYYPCEIAILKGHLGCAQILSQPELEFQHDCLSQLLTTIRGTNQYLECVKYVINNFTKDIFFKDKVTQNGYLHLVCNLGEDQYQKIRSQQSNLTSKQIKKEYEYIQSQLINLFLDKGLNGLLENRKKESPLKLCIENTNLVALPKLLTCKIIFQMESSDGTTIMQCLSNFACMGYQQMQFVQQKLNQSDVNDLRINLKKIDHNGFDFLLYFVKNFTQNAVKYFKKVVQKNIDQKMNQQEAQKIAFEQFVKFEDKFIDLIKYLVQMGCDINGQVTDQRSGDTSENFKKWGIQHFLMEFPSLKLIKFFKNKIRDFNAQNNQNRTPLHLFCMNIRKGNLFNSLIEVPNTYQAETILEYLLVNGLNPSSLDCNRSLPILYAALNHQYSFIMLLRKFKSLINVCNNKNQVPFIQIIKNSKYYNLDEIQSILKNGADPNFEDMDKRNSLHHLIYCSTNFDTSPQVCKLLFDYGAKINALDKYKRSPIFYCFTKMDVDSVEPDEVNDKVQILQVLLNYKETHLNLLDVYHRTLVHYACEKNYFFSILYLLDKNINIEIGDYEDNTPLGVCLKHRNLNQAAFLIKKGVKYGFVHDSNQKHSYFEYAMNNLSVGICFMLLDNQYPIQKALEQVTNPAFKEILIQKYINKTR